MFRDLRRRTTSTHAASGNLRTTKTIVGLNTISSTEYAMRCKLLMELHKDLQGLGAGMFFDLPRIAVIGGQSAGKSSLVEAVSGINVPRDSGTCTRCPMECTLSSSADSWSCSISLRTEFDGGGTKLDASVTEDFGPVITDKSSVELWLRRAQAAILSPHRAHAEFLNKSHAELKSLAIDDEGVILSFSKNIVHLDVKDPEVTDLSFVDLPGLIQNSDREVIQLVRDLVVHHIQASNTLILVTLPMSDDIENQQAALLANDADPTGERTIGVLTKPDTLTRGATGLRQKWREILLSQSPKHNLKRGYYCVRLPDDDERARKVSRAESQRIASDFFASNAPWNEMPDDVSRRFGIPGFVADISAVLVELIENNLPKLKESVDALLKQCIEDNNALPVLSTLDPSTEIMLRVSRFCNAFTDAVYGEKDKHYVQNNRTRYGQFKNDILLTTPDFRPFEASQATYHRNVTLVSTGTPPIDISDVAEVIRQSISWELPNHVPFDATRSLILKHTTLWDAPARSCFEDVAMNCTSFLEGLLRVHFGQYVHLEAFIRTLTRQEHERCRDEALNALEKILRLERVPLYTQNVDCLQAEASKWLAKYVNMRWPDELPRTTFADELNVMAKVQAYFQVAYKRFIDNVPLTIEHEINQMLASTLERTLFEAVVKGGDLEQLKDWVREDKVIAEKRKFLEGRRARLVLIKEKVDAFQPHTV